MPEPLDDREVDERFAQLTSSWNLETPEPGARPEVTFPFPVWRGATGPALEKALGTDGDDAQDDAQDVEDDEGFEPGPVDLPPGEDVHYWAALAGLVIGPLCVLYAALGDSFFATWWLIGGLLLLFGGFVLLVLRMPKDRDPHDEDDGARV